MWLEILVWCQLGGMPQSRQAFNLILNNFQARQEQLRSLEQHRQQLLEVQQQQQRQQGVNTNSRQQQSRFVSRGSQYCGHSDWPWSWESGNTSNKSTKTNFQKLYLKYFYYRAFSSFPSRQESFRSAAPVAIAPSSGVSDPYISGFNLRDGSYSYSY